MDGNFLHPRYFNSRKIIGLRMGVACFCGRVPSQATQTTQDKSGPRRPQAEISARIGCNLPKLAPRGRDRVALGWVSHH